MSGVNCKLLSLFIVLNNPETLVAVSRIITAALESVEEEASSIFVILTVTGTALPAAFFFER